MLDRLLGAAQRCRPARRGIRRRARPPARQFPAGLLAHRADQHGAQPVAWPRSPRCSARGSGRATQCCIIRKPWPDCRELALDCDGRCPYLHPRPYSHVPVAACRSVDIRTRGRTVARDGWGIAERSPEVDWLEPGHRIPSNDRQPERPVNPVLRGGRSLKQRRTGFFGLGRIPHPATEEACFSLPGVRTGSSRSNPRQINPAAALLERDGRLIIPLRDRLAIPAAGGPSDRLAAPPPRGAATTGRLLPFAILGSPPP